MYGTTPPLPLRWVPVRAVGWGHSVYMHVFVWRFEAPSKQRGYHKQIDNTYICLIANSWEEGSLPRKSSDVVFCNCTQPFYYCAIEFLQVVSTMSVKSDMGAAELNTQSKEHQWESMATSESNESPPFATNGFAATYFGYTEQCWNQILCNRVFCTLVFYATYRLRLVTILAWARIFVRPDVACI